MSDVAAPLTIAVGDVVVSTELKGLIHRARNVGRHAVFLADIEPHHTPLRVVHRHDDWCLAGHEHHRRGIGRVVLRFVQTSRLPDHRRRGTGEENKEDPSETIHEHRAPKQSHHSIFLGKLQGIVLDFFANICYILARQNPGDLMYILIPLLFLTACNSGNQSVLNGQRVKDQLEANLRTTVSDIALRDPALAAETEPFLVTFRDHFAPLAFTETDSGMNLMGHPPCRVPSAPYFGFAAPHQKAAERNIGGWLDRAEALFIADVLPPDDLMAPYVTLHELKHAEQYERGDPRDPLPRIAGARWPRERGATEFEVRLENAGSDGRFNRAVAVLVARSNAHELTEATYGNVVYPKLDGVAQEIFPGISPIGADLLGVSIIYAFNMALLTDTSEESRDRLVSTLQMGFTDPAVHQLYPPR